MATVTSGHSVTINAPVSDYLWEVWGGSLTIEAGAAFPMGTTISVAEGGKLTITGGTLDDSSEIQLAQGCTATISGGSVGSGLVAAQGSTATLSGGQIGPGDLWAVVQESVLTIQGSGLTIQSYDMDSKVTGTLSDGSPLTLLVQIATNQGAKVVLQNS